MGRKKLIKEIASDANLSKSTAKKVLESLLKIIKKVLIQNNKVLIRGFGSWRVFIKKARVVRHPVTGEIINVTTKNVVKFKPSGKLIYKLNRDATPKTRL